MSKIAYVPRQKTRNEDTLDQLRRMANATRPLDPAKRIENASAVIAEALAEIHGGEFRSLIDHETAFVAVCRQRSGKIAV